MGQTNSGDHRTDIVIVGWNHLDQTEKCLDSITINTADATCNIIYVDNGSATGHAFSDLLDTEVRLSKNTGYCHGNNVGLALSLLSDSEFVLLLNNDTWIPDGDTTWLERMIRLMDKNETIGAVGAVAKNVAGYQRRTAAGDRQRDAGISIPLFTPALIGFCLLLRKKAIQQVGLLDERFDLDGNYSDFDYSIRLQRAGWKLAIAESVFIHHEAHTTQKDLDFSSNLVKNKEKLFAKWDREALKLVGL